MFSCHWRLTLDKIKSLLKIKIDDLPNTDRILYLLSAGASYQIIRSLLYVALTSILYSFQGFLVVENVIHVTYVMKNKKVTK